MVAGPFGLLGGGSRRGRGPIEGASTQELLKQLRELGRQNQRLQDLKDAALSASNELSGFSFLEAITEGVLERSPSEVRDELGTMRSRAETRIRENRSTIDRILTELRSRGEGEEVERVMNDVRRQRRGRR